MKDNRIDSDEVTRALIAKMFPGGQVPSAAAYRSRALQDGNTAQVVNEVSFDAHFVLKLDDDEKVLKEGRKLQSVQTDPRLPELVRRSYGRVIALHEQAPRGYAMVRYAPEQGWGTLHRGLFPTGPDAPAVTQAHANRMLSPTLDVLVATFDATVDRRALPNTDADMLQRIVERLGAAAKKDARFASRPLRVNGVSLRGWQDMVRVLREHPQARARLTAPFSVFVHGDPHPGNILLRVDAVQVEVRLIDPKEWPSGDWVWDMTKLAHWLESTGPVENVMPSGAGATWDDRGDLPRLEYEVKAPAWVASLVAAVRERAQAFAQRHGDADWSLRFDLAMAANLLGLPAGRLGDHADASVALALYGEGLRHLARVVAQFEPAPDGSPPSPSRVIPAAIVRLSDKVRRELPEACDARDRRGFLLLHWPPPRPNQRGKPAELSLEHEARLAATCKRGVGQLRALLSASEGRAISLALPGRLGLDALSVRRVRREAGAQSVDRFHDSADSLPAIAQGFTIRERLQARGFMTWGADAGEARPLNLELPAVAVGDAGVVVRVEFNWIGRLEPAAHVESDDAWRRDPLRLAARVADLDTTGLHAVLEHTTFREKFVLVDPRGVERFHINIDRVVAQSLVTGQQGSFVDVDIAPAQVVDAAVLEALDGLAGSLAKRFGLTPSGGTKARRGALAAGLLAGT